MRELILSSSFFEKEKKITNKLTQRQGSDDARRRRPDSRGN